MQLASPHRLCCVLSQLAHTTVSILRAGALRGAQCRQSGMGRMKKDAEDGGTVVARREQLTRACKTKGAGPANLKASSGREKTSGAGESKGKRAAASASSSSGEASTAKQEAKAAGKGKKTKAGEEEEEGDDLSAGGGGGAGRGDRRPTAKRGTGAGAAGSGQDREEYVLGQRFTHPHKELFPSVTKLDLAQYYSEVSDFMLPYLRDRCYSSPRNVRQVHFLSEAAKEVKIHEKSGATETYMEFNDIEAIESAIQMDTLEFHPWISKYIPGEPEKATFLMFDLDAGSGTSFETLSFAAHVLHDTLESLGLKSYLLLSGVMGLHVTVPLSDPLRSFDEVHTFARFLAEQLAKKHPEKLTAHKNEDRTGRVFVDYIRNFRGATSICPYSTRANGSATVAVPIDWAELPEHKAPNQYNMHTVRERLERLRKTGGDPWKDIFSIKQGLTSHAMEAVLHDLP